MSPEPRLGCGAAIVRGGQILLIRRLRPPEANCWGLPGGKVDWLEPVEQAVARETLEELGVTLGPVRLLCVVDLIEPERGEHWVSPVYHATDFTGEPRIVEPHKHDGLAWFDLDAPPQPLTQATVAALKALRGP